MPTPSDLAFDAGASAAGLPRGSILLVGFESYLEGAIRRVLERRGLAVATADNAFEANGAGEVALVLVDVDRRVAAVAAGLLAELEPLRGTAGALYVVSDRIRSILEPLTRGDATRLVRKPLSLAELEATVEAALGVK